MVVDLLFYRCCAEPVCLKTRRFQYADAYNCVVWLSWGGNVGYVERGVVWLSWGGNVGYVERGGNVGYVERGGNVGETRFAEWS